MGCIVCLPKSLKEERHNNKCNYSYLYVSTYIPYLFWETFWVEKKFIEGWNKTVFTQDHTSLLEKTTHVLSIIHLNKAILGFKSNPDGRGGQVYPPPPLVLGHI